MLHKNLPLILLLSLLSAFGAKSQCIYPAQPGRIDGIDAICHRYPICSDPNTPCDTTNKGDTRRFTALASTKGGVPRIMRSFMKFDLSDFGTITSDGLPTSAKLDLYFLRNGTTDDEHINPGGAFGNALFLERVTQDWAEDTIRWQFPASSGNLRMPTVTTKKTPKDIVLIPATTSGTQDITVDLTEMVKFWLEQPDSNFGFRIRLAEENTSSPRQVNFCSSDYPDANYRPRLEIDFPKVVASAGKDTIVCSGRSILLDGSGGSDYLWIPLDASNDILSKYDVPNPRLKGTKAQSFEVEVSIGTCSDRDQVAIDFGVPSAAEITVPTGEDTTLCEGDSIQLSARGGSFYNWLPAEAVDNNTSPNPYAKAKQNTRVYVEVRSAGDRCPGIDSFDLKILKQTQGAVAFADSTICSGDEIQLGASGGIFYSWTPADSLNNANIDNPIAKVKGTTEFVVTINNVNSCADTQRVKITVSGGVSFDAGPDQTICRGDTLQLNVPGTGTFTWNNSQTLDDPFVGNPKAFPTSTTTYVINLVDADKCTGTDELTINVNPVPVISVSASDSLVCPKELVTLTATGAVNYVWSTGETTSEKSASIDDENSETTYKVIGDDGNCESDTAYITIRTERCSGDLVLVPKYFSPNGDGVMDNFIIQDIRKYENEVIIFNKWGDVIFQKRNYDNRWNGVYNGREVAEDTYMYLVRVKPTGEEAYTDYKGTLTILRSKR